MESQTSPPLPFVPFPVPFRLPLAFGSPVAPPPPGKVHVAVPRAMWPRGFGDAANAFEKKYGGKLVFIFAHAVRDELGRLVKPGYLAHVLIETDAPAAVTVASAPRRPEPKDPTLASFVRDLARMTARSWATAACEYQEVVG